MAFRAFFVKLVALLLLALPILVHGVACPAAQSDICNVSTSDNKPPHLECGSRGKVNSKSARGATLEGPCTASYQTCRNSCLAKKRCISFQHSSGSRTCVLYSEGPKALGFTDDPSSTQQIYNRRCFTFDSCTPEPTPTPTPTPFIIKDPASGHVLITLPDGSTRYGRFTSDTAAAYKFILNGTKLIDLTDSAQSGTSLIGNAHPEYTYSSIYFDPEAPGKTPVACAKDGNEFTCSIGSMTQFATNGNADYLLLYDPAVGLPNGYHQISIQAIPSA